MLQQTEAYQLIVAVILAPLIVRSLRSIDLPGSRPASVGVAAMALAFVFTVVEGFYEPELFNILEHAMYAVSGVAFLWSTVEGAVYWFRRGGEAT
jgi:hypothetical protein